MPKHKQQRRGKRGAAWYWKQTDSWYYTPAGTKLRIPLFDEKGKRIRGAGNRSVATMSLARIQIAAGLQPKATIEVAKDRTTETTLVAKVCSDYIKNCESGVANGRMSSGYRDDAV